MKKSSFLIVSCLYVMALTSCGDSAEIASEKVCDCISDIGTRKGNASRCLNMNTRYERKFKNQPEELKAYKDAVILCGLFKILEYRD
jgi:hypothetical protein